MPQGVRDFLPRAAARRRIIVERLVGEFESFGYARIITPAFECADVLERGLGPHAKQSAIRFVEPGSGEVVALRPDITPQVARMAASRMAEVDGPLRYCYEGAIMRMQRGVRIQREILQAGVELIGAGSPEADAEVISVAAAALATVGIDHVRLDLGHVAPVRHLLSAVPDPRQREDIERLLRRKARAEVGRASAGLDAPLRSALQALPTLYGAPREVLKRARALTWPAPVMQAFEAIEAVFSLSRQVVESEFHATITLDLGEIRGFDYYTGIRFSGYADGVGNKVLQGGRYDELVGCYGAPAQATGFAVDVEAIAEAQAERGIEVSDGRSAILVTTTQRRRHEGMRVAAGLRAGGLRAAVDLGPRRGREAISRYARAVGFTHVLSLEGTGAKLATVAADDAGASAPPTVLAAELVTHAAAGDATEIISAILASASEAPGAASRGRERSG